MLLKESLEINNVTTCNNLVQKFRIRNFTCTGRTPEVWALSSGPKWREGAKLRCHGSYIQHIEVSGCQNPWNFISLVIPKLRQVVVETRIFSACQARRKDALTNMGHGFVVLRCLENLGNVVAVRVTWILHGFFLLVTALFIVCS